MDKAVDAIDGDRLPKRFPGIMDRSRRIYGQEAILWRVAEGPPPLVMAPKVCRYLDKRFAKFQVPEDRNELLKYIEGMKGMTRG